jgi:hypothetical protein
VSEMNAEERATFERFKLWKHRRKDHSPASPDDPTPQVVYDSLMKETFAPALRQIGLKGSGGRFDLPADQHWVLLGFQKSAYSDSNEVQFTVNLAVIDRAVWLEQVAARPHLGKRPSPGTLYGAWADQTRIGALIPPGDDLWWRLIRGQDSEPIAASVVSALRDTAVPWLLARASAE